MLANLILVMAIAIVHKNIFFSLLSNFKIPLLYYYIRYWIKHDSF